MSYLLAVLNLSKVERSEQLKFIYLLKSLYMIVHSLKAEEQCI